MSLTYIFINLCGLRNINFDNAKIEKLSPINIYIFVLIIATLSLEIVTLYYYEIDIIKEFPHFNTIIFVIRNKIDVICTLSCWISELLNYSNKVELYRNLRQIDSMLLNHLQDDRKPFAKKYMKTCIIYVIYKILTISYDYFVWKFIRGQVFTMFKYCIVELVIFKFFFEMDECLKRVRILNEKLAILHCGREFIEVKSVDFRNHSEIFMLVNEEVSDVKFKNTQTCNMKNIINAYFIISDNTKRIENFYGVTVSKYVF